MSNWFRAIIVTLALFLSAVAVDQIMGLLGLPAAREIQVAHPSYYYERRKTIEFEYEFQTNSMGLRYRDISLEKGDNEVRFLVLGDSLTEGVGVEANETFASLLEERMSNMSGKGVRFINGGLQHTGPLQYWRLFYFVGLQYEPDVVIVCIYANDVSDTPETISRRDLYIRYSHDYASKEFGLRKIMHFLFPRGYTMLSIFRDRAVRKERKRGEFVQSVAELAESQGISDKEIKEWEQSLDKDLTEAVNKGKLNGALLAYPLLRPRYWKNTIDIDSSEAERKFLSMSLVLDEITNVARTKGARIGLVYLPARWQYEVGVHELDHPMVKGGMVRKSWLTSRSEIQNRLERWAAKRSVPFLDLTNTFRDESRKGKVLNYGIDVHWNQAGHSVAAAGIESWIEENQFLEVPDE